MAKLALQISVERLRGWYSKKTGIHGVRVGELGSTELILREFIGSAGFAIRRVSIYPSALKDGYITVGFVDPTEDTFPPETTAMLAKISAAFCDDDHPPK